MTELNEQSLSLLVILEGGNPSDLNEKEWGLLRQKVRVREEKIPFVNAFSGAVLYGIKDTLEYTGTKRRGLEVAEGFPYFFMAAARDYISRRVPPGGLQQQCDTFILNFFDKSQKDYEHIGQYWKEIKKMFE